MPRPKQPCKRCDSAVPGQHLPACRYFKNAAASTPAVRPVAAKIRKRVFTIDHADGSETTVTVAGPAGAVRCNSTEQSVQIWTGEQPATAHHATQFHPQSRGVTPASNDVARSGEEYTTTDALDDVPGGTLGLSDEDTSNPDAILQSLERKRLGMIGHMASESSSSDVILVPEGAN